MKQMDGIAVNGPDIRKDGLKHCKWFIFMSKIFEKYFQMDNLIDRMGYRSHFLHQIVATPQNLSHKRRVVVFSIP